MAGPIALCFMGAAFRLPRAGQGYDPHRTGCRAASADQHRRKPRRAARDPPQRGERIDEGIRQLPDGRWQARPTLGTDPVTGRQVRAVKTFPTKREAKNWVKDQHNQWDRAAWAPRTHLTLDEVADHWLRLREAEEQQAVLQQKWADLQDSTVVFSGKLLLRIPGGSEP